MKTTPIKQGLSKFFKKNEKAEELANVLIEKNLIDGNKEVSSNLGFTNNDLVFCIHPKNELIKAFIKNNFEFKELDTPKLDFKVCEQDKDKEISASYSIPFLKAIIKMCEGYEKVKIKMKRNFPISIETDDFECLLAPRIRTEDDL
jgi:hypothetical protein